MTSIAAVAIREVVITGREDTEVRRSTQFICWGYLFVRAGSCRCTWVLTSFLWMVDDDSYDRNRQRRRYEEPPSVAIRKQLLTIAESVC